LDLTLSRRILDAMIVSAEISNPHDRELTQLHGVPLSSRRIADTSGVRP
jgi:hypothetical protein